MSHKLSSIKLSADDYDIKESELPKEAAAIQEEKKAVLTQLEDAESKLKIQTAVNKLFTKTYQTGSKLWMMSSSKKSWQVQMSPMYVKI